MPDQSDTNHISADFEALVKDLQLIGSGQPPERILAVLSLIEQRRANKAIAAIAARLQETNELLDEIARHG